MHFETIPRPIADVARAEMATYEVPGLAVGILHGGTFYAGGFGITSVEHPLPVTPETLFQIGSTSKTVTATVAMQLVGEGKLDLESRVRQYLPAFALRSEEDANRLTVRHLVTHHGGWQGDYFRDTGRGDDAIARIVAKMANSPQLVAAGTAFSYNNAGFYVLAHIIETLEGEPFESVVRRRVIGPLEMHRTFYFPEDAMTHRFAAGHIRTAGGPRVARPWPVARSIAGGGGVISDVLDQLRYAAFHCGDGLTPAGARLLSEAAIRLMQTPQASAGSMCENIGVAWMLDPTPSGHLRVKHGGATNGHLSSFEMVPGLGFACTVLTNADSGRGPRDAVAEAAMHHFLGFRLQTPAPSQSVGPELADYAGRYRAALAELEVVADGNGLRVTEHRPQRALDAGPVPLANDPVTVRVMAPDRCAIVEGPRRGERCEFLRDSDGRVAWMRWDGRLARRIQPPEMAKRL